MKPHAPAPGRKGFTPNPPNSERGSLSDRGRSYASRYFPTPAEIQTQADAYTPIPPDQLDPDNPGGLFFDAPDLDSPLSVVLPKKQPATAPPPQSPTSPLPVVLPRAEPSVQTRLTVGQPGDKYEQEADNKAAEVMAKPEPVVLPRKLQPLPARPTQPNPSGLYFAPPDLDSPLSVVLPRKQHSNPPVPQPSNSYPPVVLPRKEPPSPSTPQPSTFFPPFGPDNPGSIRDYDPDPRPTLSARELVERSLARKPPNAAPPGVQAKEGQAAPENFEQKLGQHQGGGKALSPEARDFMEPRFGADFSQVKVHETPDLTNAIQAQAFTHGTDIYFNSGKYNPGSSSGKEL
ncbi:MAG: DUF4157 domain-containing protein, partial [Cyanobacteria bacterium P01_H01_bin.152]